MNVLRVAAVALNQHRKEEPDFEFGGGECLKVVVRAGEAPQRTASHVEKIELESLPDRLFVQLKEKGNVPIPPDAVVLYVDVLEEVTIFGERVTPTDTFVGRDTLTFERALESSKNDDWNSQ